MDKNPLHAQLDVDPVEEIESMPRKRPFGVTLLLWLVLSLSAWGLLRLAGALRWWELLQDKEAHLGPLYLSITGAGWAIAGLVLLWSIWSVKRWASLAIPISVSVWLVEYWIERLFFQMSRSNLPFAIVTSLLVLAITSILALHPKTKIYLTKSEEHEQPEEYSTPA